MGGSALFKLSGSPLPLGALAQLIERGIRIAEVRSLNLLRSTKKDLLWILKKMF